MNLSVVVVVEANLNLKSPLLLITSHRRVANPPPRPNHPVATFHCPPPKHERSTGRRLSTEGRKRTRDRDEERVSFLILAEEKCQEEKQSWVDKRR